MNNSIRIDDLYIKSFRGLNELKLNDCGDVNIILGDNNCGKTSILEAIQLFKDSKIYNLVDIIRARKIDGGVNSITDFVYLFNTQKNSIEVSAKINNHNNSIFIDYQMNEVLFSKDAFLNAANNNYNSLVRILFDINKMDGQSINQMSGTIKYNEIEEQYSFNNLDLLLGNLQKKKNSIVRNIVYEAPFAHFKLTSNMISNIKKDSLYYDFFIKVLKEFDSEISDVEILTKKEGSLDIPEINIKRNEEYMPVSLYGDGIKKVMCLASMLYKARNGILLIDEIETSLHHDYYLDIIYFLIKVCKAYNVQLFITTHNEEIIDVLSKYNKNNDAKTMMQFYTVKKKNNKTISRVLSDLDVEKYNLLGVEVRN